MRASASQKRVGQRSINRRMSRTLRPSDRNAGWTITRLMVRTCALAKAIRRAYDAPISPKARSRPAQQGTGCERTPTAAVIAGAVWSGGSVKVVEGSVGSVGWGMKRMATTRAKVAGRRGA